MPKISTLNKKMLVASTIGSIFEIFDFLNFVFLSSIIATLFFPKSLYGLNITFTYLTIAVSYLLRPIGGLILGHLGDKYGRKSVFTLSILLMSIPSFLISITPTFAQIGYAATFLMILLRILQGFSLGGEVPGSITYIKEQFSHNNYYFYTAWLTFGANIGVVFAALSVRILSQTTSHIFMYVVGWRIPFLIGGLLTIVGFYIRKSVTESAEFKKLLETKHLAKAPLFTLLNNYKSELICGILLSIIVSVTTSVFHVILPNLFVLYFNFSLNAATDISIVGAITLAVFSLIFAFLTRYLNVILIIRSGLISLIIIFALLLTNLVSFHAILSNHSIGYLYLIVFAISLALSAINGTFFGILANLFPTMVRFSGIAFCYNFAYIIGAGLTPIWTDLIIKNSGSYNLIVVVCLVVAIISLINSLSLKRLTISS